MKDHYLKEELYDLVKTDSSIFDFLQAGSLDGLWYWDLENSEHEWMSPHFWELFGYDHRDMKHFASEWQDMIHPDDLPTALENFNAHCADPGHPYDQIVRYQHKEGKTIWVRCRGIAIRDAKGKALRMLGAHTDLTSLKESEAQSVELRKEAEDANLAKSHFLSNMSHELRSPLNAIIGFAEMLKLAGSAGFSRERQDEYVGFIHQSSLHLMTLINNILDLSKIEAQELELEITPFDLDEILEDVCSLQSARALEKGIDLNIERSGSYPHCFNGDSMRIKQILLNLSDNAIKFTERGSVTLGVEKVDDRDDVAVMKFTIRDTGTGVSPENVEKLFTPFSQADSSISRDFGGSGLGLSICKQLAEAMSGAVGVESRLGDGSVFWFEIPLEISQPA